MAEHSIVGYAVHVIERYLGGNRIF
jgi:hypothetical protein